MARGLKTGGRTKGTPNRATVARQQEIAATGLTPLDYMLSIMRDESNPTDMRLDAANKAAPYVHPKLAAVEHTGKGGVALTPTIIFEGMEAAKEPEADDERTIN